ncbi:MAG TPA: hypothetical protein VFI02_20535 [Armatimonadota bacterium]|nr:hypothetical protein [Armatimonadota bacterium]
MKTVTVVYDVVNEAEWAKRNPLHYAYDGLKAVRVGIGDALDARDALTELLPFVEEDYYPNCATPEFKDAMIHALRCTANAALAGGEAVPSNGVVGGKVEA